MTDEHAFILNVDLDGVVADYTTAIRERIADTLGVDASTLGEQRDWEYSKCGWGIDSRDDYLAIHRDAVADGMFATMPEIPGASDTLWALSDAGIYIRIVTHRLVTNWAHAQAVADTVGWLQTPRADGRPRIPFRDLCFLAWKADVAGDVLIDDGPHNVETVRESRRRGKPSPQPIVFDAPYNRHVSGPRAHNWDEVVELIEASQRWRSGDPLADTVDS